MSIFRRTRLSDDQLREVLQSLPAVSAPADFEGQLDRMIAMHGEYVPHMLGAMPMVPAPDDFDARLREAIGDRSRPVSPIPAAIASGASINWLNHMMGWIGGSLAVVVVAFFISKDTETPEARHVATMPVPVATSVASHTAKAPAAGGSVGTPQHAVAATQGAVAGMQPGTDNGVMAAQITPSLETPVQIDRTHRVRDAAAVNQSATAHNVSADATVRTRSLTPPHSALQHAGTSSQHNNAVSTVQVPSVDLQRTPVLPPPGVSVGGDTTSAGDNQSTSQTDPIDTGGKPTQESDPKNQ